MSAAYEGTPKLMEYIDKQTAFSDIPRNIGWDVLKSACKILDGVFDAFNQVLSLNFYEIPGIKNFVNTTMPIAWAAFGIAITIGAIFLAINKDKLKISDFFKNVLIAAALIVALPFSLSIINDMKNAGVGDMQQQLKQNETLGKTILASITTDIDKSSDSKSISTLLDSNLNSYAVNVTDTLSKSKWGYGIRTKAIDMTSDKGSGKTYREAVKTFFELSDSEVSTYYSKSDADKKTYFKDNLQTRLANLKNNPQILLCETLEAACALYPQSIRETAPNIPFKSIPITDPELNTQYYLYKLNDGDIAVPGEDIHLDFLEENLYAYKYDFLMGFLLVVVTIVALFFAGFRVVGLMFDLVFNQILAPIVFATDLQGSGRTKKMIENIVASNIVFIVILILVKLYLEINLWAITTLVKPIFIFLKLIILVGTAKGVIDGPDIIVKLLGVDAGVKSGAAAMLGLQSAGKYAHSIANFGRNAVNAPSNVGKALYGRATSNPITNARDYMRKSKLDRENLKSNWSDYKGSRNSSAQPMSNFSANQSSGANNNTQAMGNQSDSGSGSDTAKPKM